MFCEKVVLKYFSKFTGKHLFQSLRSEAKKETLPQNFEKFLKTHFLKELLRWLLLMIPKNIFSMALLQRIILTFIKPKGVKQYNLKDTLKGLILVTYYVVLHYDFE